MRQSLFEARYAPRWDEFDTWLRTADSLQRPGARLGFAAEEFAPRYREICQHLALARDRHYSPDLVDRLNALALGGHYTLYGARGDALATTIEFIARGFPCLVRAEWRYVALASVLFFGPLIILLALLRLYPEAVHYWLDGAEIRLMESMYSEAAARLGAREAQSDIYMFAYYIWNNVRIGFQTFAGGMAFGLGSLFFLVYNGVHMGTAAGFLTNAGLGEPFWSFVAGHSGPELIAITLSGAAGLRLGHALIAPGARSRRQALLQAASIAIRIVIGAAVLFVAAAFIEGFWSPHLYIPATGKYAVGVTLWLLIIAYLAFTGRGGARSHPPGADH